MARRDASSGGMGGPCCQPNGLPLPSAAWDADGCLPGALIPAVEADPLRGERCPHCQRAYGGEEPAETKQGGRASPRRLSFNCSWRRPGSRRLDAISRLAGGFICLRSTWGFCQNAGVMPNWPSTCACILPRFPRASDACPLAFQALCKLRHKPRKPHSPKLANRGQTPDSIGDSKRQYSPP